MASGWDSDTWTLDQRKPQEESHGTEEQSLAQEDTLLREREGYKAGVILKGLEPPLRNVDFIPQTNGSESFGLQGPLRVQQIWGI